MSLIISDSISKRHLSEIQTLPGPPVGTSQVLVILLNLPAQKATLSATHYQTETKINYPNYNTGHLCESSCYTATAQLTLPATNLDPRRKRISILIP